MSTPTAELPRWRPPVPATGARTVELAPMLLNVLDSLCEGKDNAAIAADWGITADTVKTHLKRLFRALQADDRAHAVALATTGAVDVRIKPPAGRWVGAVKDTPAPVTVIGEWL